MNAAPPDPTVRGVPALISYLAFICFGVVASGVFWLIVQRIPVDSAMLTVLGSVVTAAIAGPAAVYGYWLASSASSVSSNARKDAVIAQAAGAGPPPPAPAQPVEEPTHD